MIDANLDCGPTTLEFDMLQELQEALAAQRNHYTHSPGFAFAETPGQAQRLRIEGREEECVVGLNIFLLAYSIPIPPTDYAQSRVNDVMAIYRQSASCPLPLIALIESSGWASKEP